MTTPELKREVFNIGAVHTNARVQFEQLISATATFKFTIPRFHRATFRAYEGFRHPMRQYYLLKETSSTKAGPWESAHQYGLAVDFAVWAEKPDGSGGFWGWPDDAPWGKLKDLARSFNLDVPIAWDRGHVEHPLFRKIRALT